MVHPASRGLPLDAWEGLGVEGQVCLLLTCPHEHECGATCVTLGMWTCVGSCDTRTSCDCWCQKGVCLCGRDCVNVCASRLAQA